nr:MAG: hypothetical protein [Cressdnaviricota sp.]
MDAFHDDEFLDIVAEFKKDIKRLETLNDRINWFVAGKNVTSSSSDEAVKRLKQNQADGISLTMEVMDAFEFLARHQEEPIDDDDNLSYSEESESEDSYDKDLPLTKEPLPFNPYTRMF